MIPNEGLSQLKRVGWFLLRFKISRKYLGNVHERQLLPDFKRVKYLTFCRSKNANPGNRTNKFLLEICKPTCDLCEIVFLFLFFYFYFFIYLFFYLFSSFCFPHNASPETNTPRCTTRARLRLRLRTSVIPCSDIPAILFG